MLMRSARLDRNVVRFVVAAILVLTVLCVWFGLVSK